MRKLSTLTKQVKNAPSQKPARKPIKGVVNKIREIVINNGN